MNGIRPISAVGTASPIEPSYAGSHATDDLRQTRETLAKAVLKANKANIAGVGREVTFSIDSTTRRPVVKVVETDTKEVVAQWPSEDLLRLTQELDRSKGIHDESY